MSTKIYNGYKLPNMSLVELHDFCMKFKKDIREELEKLYVSKLSLLATNIIDNIKCGFFTTDSIKEYFNNYNSKDKDTILPSLAAEIYMYECRKKIKISNERDPFNDFSFDVTFFPTINNILAIIFTEQKTFKEIWESQLGVEYYGYWNNTDPIDGISYEDWEKRGDEWDKVLGDDFVPALNGLTFDPIADNYPAFCDTKKLVEYQPGLEFRKDRLTELILCKKFDKYFKEKNGEENIYFSVRYNKYKQWLEDNPEETQKAKDSIKIKEKLEIEDFKKEYPIKLEEGE